MAINLKSQIYQGTKDLKNKTTRKAYRNSCNDYVKWAQKRKIHDFSKEHIQTYYYDLKKRDITENTRHNYISALCHVGRISQNDLEHDKRTEKLIRSRSDTKNMQGYAEERSGRFERLVKGQDCIGIRRHELAHLKGCNLRTDESGYLCVEVERGKGGKHHLQRILPEDVAEVTKLFKGIERDERVFASKEMKNHIDLHSHRRKHAQRVYAYYNNRLEREPGYAKQLRQEIIKRYFEEHPKSKLPDELRFQLVNPTPYETRGRVKQQAIEHDRPIEFNRLAVIATSVFSLSHWRSNVAVKNYLT